MPNTPMYTFVIEEVAGDGHILNQSLIFGHDEEDAISRHSLIYPRNSLMDEKKVTFRAFPLVQWVAPPLDTIDYTEKLTNVQ